MRWTPWHATDSGMVRNSDRSTPAFVIATPENRAATELEACSSDHVTRRKRRNAPSLAVAGEGFSALRFGVGRKSAAHSAALPKQAPGRAPPPLRTGRLRAPASGLLIGGLALLACLETNLACARETMSLFGNGIPSHAVAADHRGVTLGVKFLSAKAGKISAIRFYRGARSPAGYVARLYTASGRLLASVSLPTETGPIPGWQTATLPRPVSIAAHTTYVAAYYTPNGRAAGLTIAGAALGRRVERYCHSRMSRQGHLAVLAKRHNCQKSPYSISSRLSATSVAPRSVSLISHQTSVSFALKLARARGS